MNLTVLFIFFFTYFTRRVVYKNMLINFKYTKILEVGSCSYCPFVIQIFNVIRK